MKKTCSSVMAILIILLFAGRTFAGDVTLLTNKEYFPVLEERIAKAREEILVSVFVFKTTQSTRNLATRLRESLVSAASRGVKVTVLLEKERGGRRGSSLNEDNNYTAKVLSRGGVKVYFDEPDTTTHTKLVTIDNRYLFIGSHNFTESALRYNNEASVMIDSPQMAREAASFITGMSKLRHPQPR